MSDYLSIFVPIVVVPKHDGEVAVGAGGRRYPRDGKRFKRRVDNARAITQYLWLYRPKKPLDGPVSLDAWFRFPFPKCTPKDKRISGAWKYTTPDTSNLMKQLEDCLQAAEWIVNDSRICHYGDVAKVFHEEPGVRVTLRKLKP